MPKFTEEDKEKLQDKLEYIGLDLDEIPTSILEFQPLEYRPSKVYGENTYKVYRFIPIDQIKILLTKSNRLDPLSEKYEKASPIATYLAPQKEEDIPKTAIFFNLLAKVQKENIEKIEKEQKCLKKEIPFKVKYPANYLWQIYYSEYTDQYFMLVPIEDQEYASFFYLLKKQLEYAKQKEKNPKAKPESIFVPIGHCDYEQMYLKAAELSDIENYLWLFTKDWPLVYEVWDQKENLSLQIVGETIVYEKIKSPYKIKLTSKEEAISFYKLIKALFILQTELKNEYQFKVKISKEAGLSFFWKEEEITYQNLADFTKRESLLLNEKVKKTAEKMQALNKEVKVLKEAVSEKELEYLNQERLIATYLECKKSFFGKLKFFLKGKKEKKKSYTKVASHALKEKYKDIKNIDNGNYGLPDKEFYTIEDLIKVSKAYEQNEIQIENAQLDKTALENRKEKMELKVKNAALYLQEIEDHRKSIFEFWKFTNKDEKVALMEASKKEETTTEKTEKLEKVFDMEEDFEEIGSQLDAMQRKVLTQEEKNAIYLLTTGIRKDMNKLGEENQKEDEWEESLKIIKENAKKEKELLANEEFDIFGNLPEDRTKIKTLANKKHRESRKDSYHILGITKHTQVTEYKAKLEETRRILQEALIKLKAPISLSIYQAKKQTEKIENGYQVFHIKPEEAIQEEKGNHITLYRLEIKKDILGVCYATNSIYYDNHHNTLPLGMDVTDHVILNTEDFTLEKQKEEVFRMNVYAEEKNELSKMQVKEIKVCEYTVVPKNRKEDGKDD